MSCQHPLVESVRLGEPLHQGGVSPDEPEDHAQTIISKPRTRNWHVVGAQTGPAAGGDSPPRSSISGMSKITAATTMTWVAARSWRATAGGSSKFVSAHPPDRKSERASPVANQASARHVSTEDQAIAKLAARGPGGPRPPSAAGIPARSTRQPGRAGEFVGAHGASIRLPYGLGRFRSVRSTSPMARDGTAGATCGAGSRARGVPPGPRPPGQTRGTHGSRKTRPRAPRSGGTRARARIASSRRHWAKVTVPIGSWSRTQKMCVRMKPIWSVEDLEPAGYLLVGLLGTLGQLLERQPLPLEQRQVLHLGIDWKTACASGDASWVAVIRRSSCWSRSSRESLIRSISTLLSRILVERQLRGRGGQLMTHDPGPLRPDPAEVVVEPQGVEMADAVIVEQAFDRGEVGLGAVGQVLLIVERGLGVRRQAAFSYLRTWAWRSSSSALRRARNLSSGSSAAAGASVHCRRRAPGSGPGDRRRACTGRAFGRAPGWRAERGRRPPGGSAPHDRAGRFESDDLFLDLEPLGLDPGFPREVDEPLPSQLAFLGRFGRRDGSLGSSWRDVSAATRWWILSRSIRSGDAVPFALAFSARSFSSLAFSSFRSLVAASSASFISDRTASVTALFGPRKTGGSRAAESWAVWSS